MNLCPTEHDLHELLADRLPDAQRTTVEGHIEACPACQRQLDALTQADELKLAPPHAGASPPFLARIQSQYPSTLLHQESATNGPLHFPEPPSECAPLGQVGDFEILAELGSGSFGWVFRARERSLDRIVALKVLKPEMTARPDAIVRFEREARKASLKHDHIVNVYRFEKPAGFPPYLVMEYVEGETLDTRLKREGKLTPEAAAAIVRQVALGLAAAHECGMVHRDIKPSNILLDKTGRAKISDFGLARDIADESLAVTQTGEMAGTAPYMSPEHFRSPDKVDGRSDLFSLGVVLYQLLTGQLPFKGSFLQIRSGILEDEPPSPRKLCDAVPIDLATIALACLEKDRERRYPTAQALAEDLRRYQNGEPILCRPIGQVERTIKWARRKPAQAALVGVGTIAMLILAVLIAGFFVNAELQKANDNLAQAKGELLKTNDQLSKQEAHVRRLNYVADMNLAYQAWQNDNLPLLEQYLTTYDQSELRGFEWHYLRWLANTTGAGAVLKDQITAVAFDPSGNMLALGIWTGSEAQVQIWRTPSKDRPQGELLHTLTKDVGAVTDIAFHPHTDLVITSDRKGDSVSVWDFKTGKKTLTLDGHAPFAVSPDGQVLAYVRLDGTIARWSFTSQRAVGAPVRFADFVGGAGNKGKPGRIVGSKPGDDLGPRFPKPGADKTKPRMPVREKPRGGGAEERDSVIQQLAFSADGSRLVAVGGYYKVGGAVVVWNLQNARTVALEDAEQNDIVTAVACSADSIAAVGFDHALRVWDATTGKLRFRRNAAHKLEVLSVSFDGTGTRLATAGWDKTVKLWNARTGEELRNLRGSGGVVERVLFRPGSNRDNIVSLNQVGELRWWDAEQEQNARVFPQGEPAVALVFGRDGRHVAYFGRNGYLRVQNLRDQTERHDFPEFPPPLREWFDGRLVSSEPLPPKIRTVGPSGQQVLTGAVSPDGKLFAVPNEDYSISLRDTETLAERHRLTGHLCVVGCLTFSPDGKRLVSGSEDWTIKIWDIEVGRATVTLGGHKGRIRAVAFSPDGTLLVSASEDATLRIWPGK